MMYCHRDLSIPLSRYAAYLLVHVKNIKDQGGKLTISSLYTENMQECSDTFEIKTKWKILILYINAYLLP